MNNDTSQVRYWNDAAASKTFTHPLNVALLQEYIARDACVLDYGCGYGRLCGELAQDGFSHVLGVDFSDAMISRAREGLPHLSFDVVTRAGLALPDRSVDAVLLFAVLTCVPDSAGQQAIVADLHRVLKPGGIVYLSDYPLQTDARNLARYEQHAASVEAYGTFMTDDGAVVRHHPIEWFDELFKGFMRESATDVEVVTMNGHRSMGYQAIFRKSDQTSGVATINQA
jgi:SAM-dependent methyltransferase